MQAKGPKVVLAVIADVHAGLTAPVFRAGEKDWLAAQARPWVTIRKLCKKHDCPLAICGDLFDRWDAKPEVVNWLMGQLPRKQKVYAVPGNHDLPNHDVANVHRSAYWTLEKAKRIWSIHDGIVDTGKVVLVGFAHGHKLTHPHGILPPPPGKDGRLFVAIVHDYCWDTGRAFPGAPKEKHWSAHLKAAGGSYRVLCFGDNHHRFAVQDNSRTIVNCGGLLIRNSDELGRNPSVWLIHEDGSASWVLLDTSQDVYDHELVKDVKGFGLDEDTANELVSAAKELVSVSIDFRRVLRDLARSTGVRKAVVGLLKEWTEGAER